MTSFVLLSILGNKTNLRNVAVLTVVPAGKPSTKLWLGSFRLRVQINFIRNESRIVEVSLLVIIIIISIGLTFVLTLPHYTGEADESLIN